MEAKSSRGAHEEQHRGERVGTDHGSFMPCSAAFVYQGGMNTFHTLTRHLAPVFMVAALAVPARAALPVAVPSVPSLIQRVAVNCTAIGQSVAARDGGQLRSAMAVESGGRTVCRIVYTVPSRDGQPPRRVQTDVDAG